MLLPAKIFQGLNMHNVKNTRQPQTTKFDPFLIIRVVKPKKYTTHFSTQRQMWLIINPHMKLERATLN